MGVGSFALVLFLVVSYPFPCQGFVVVVGRVLMPVSINLSTSCASRWCAGHFCMLGLSSLPRVVGLGKDPHSFSDMRGAHRVRSQHTPLRIVPQAGKILEDGDKSAST